MSAALPVPRGLIAWMAACLVALCAWAQAAAGAPPASDDFNRCVVPGGSWSLVDPLGGASVDITGAGSSDARLLLSVPGGQSHNAWGAPNPAPRLIQAVDDTDLTVTVKFDAVPTGKYQDQGIVVQQDSGTWLRFDLYNNGSQLRAFAAATVNGSSSAKADKSVSGGAPIWMQVIRQGNTWTQRYSLNGSSWTTNVSFSQAMTVTGVGPFVANHDVSGAGTALAHTAVIDYFESSAAPIASEDGGTPGGQGALATAVAGEGTVTGTPAGSSHACGSSVSLQAAAQAGWTFTGWSGDLSGTTNPASVTIDGPTTQVTATFASAGEPPVVSGVAVDAGETSATVTWTTDEPATSRVDYGLTAAHEIGDEGSASLVTSHSVTLNGLDPDTTYHYAVTSADAGGLTTSSADATFQTDAVAPQVTIASDDFNRCVVPGSPWSVVDPVGDGTVDIAGAGTADAALRLSVPAGVSHNPWVPVNRSLRIMQPAPDEDVALEVKFASALTSKNQNQGLLVQQDADDWIRFDIYHTGSGLRAFAASVAGGSASTKVNKTVAAGAPMWLRVTRQGSSWTFQHSLNGTGWTTLGTFSRALAVTSVGVFAANHDAAGAGTSPAHTAVVDYFQTTAAPIASEDGGTPGGQGSITVDTVGQGTVGRSPSGDTLACGTQVQLTASPQAGWTFAGWSGDLDGSTSPATVAIDGPATAVTATFESVAPNPPPVVSNVQATPGETSATITWTTDEPATSRVDYGLTAAHEIGDEGSATLVTSHSVTLNGLDPDTTYHYAVTSADGDGQATTTGDATFTTTGGVVADPGIDSDDFNTPNLKTGVWSLVDPLGGGTVLVSGAGTGSAQLSITAPGGPSHNPAGVDRSVRIVQPADDEDLALEVKFGSPVSSKYQMQGIVVHQDADDWLRFDLYSDGSATRAFAGATIGGGFSAKGDIAVPGGAPMWMRVERVGDTWTQRYSADGQTWTTTATFTQALTVSQVGVMAANHDASGPGTAPAHTAIVDYFASDADPISGEDQGSPPDTLAPLVHAISTQPAASSIQVGWATDENATRTVRYGTTTAYELGQVSAPGTGTSHSVTVPNLQAQTTYHLQIVSTDAGGRSASSSDITVTTTAGGGGPPTGQPVIDVWEGDTQSFGAPGRAQDVANVSGDVTDPDGIASLTYRLNGGPAQPLSIGPDDRRLDQPGDFNAEVPFTSLNAGANQVLLSATDTTGATATRTVTVNYSPGNVWPLPYTTNWAGTSNLQQAAQLVDGHWETTSGGVRPTTKGYDRLLAVGDVSWQDYEVSFPVTVHQIDTVNGYPFPSNGPAVGVFLRWQGHTATGSEQPRSGFFPAGAYAVYSWRPDGTERYELIAQNVPRKTSSAQLQIGQTYIFKMRVTTQPSGHGLYQFRSWKVGDPEPTGWMFQTEGAADLASGSVLLIAHHLDATFGNLTVTPL